MKNKGVLIDNFESSIALELYESLYKSKDKRQCSYVFLNKLKKSLKCKNVLLIEKNSSGHWMTLADGRLKIQKRKIELSDRVSLFGDSEDYKLLSGKGDNLDEKYNADNIDAPFLHLIFLDETHLLLIENNNIISSEVMDVIISPVRAFYDFSQLLPEASSGLTRLSSSEISCKAGDYDATSKLKQLIINTAKKETPMGLIGLDDNFNIIELNAAAKLLVEKLYNKNINIGDNFKALYNDKEFEELDIEVFSNLRNGDSVDKLITKDVISNQIHISYKYRPLVNGNSDVKGYLILMNDVSETEKTRLKAENNKLILKTILDLSESSYVAYDINLNVTFCNHSAISLHKRFLNIDLKKGMHISEISNNKSSFWHDIPIEDIDESLYHKANSVTYYENGETKIINLYLAPIRDKEGQMIGLMESSIDVTEDTMKTQELKERKATLDAILNSSKNGIYAVDKNMILLAVNRESQRDFLEYCGKQVVVGTDLHDVIPKKDLNRWKKEYFNKVFAGEELTYIGPLTEDRAVDNMYYPVINSDDEIIACLELSRDISEIVTKQQELVKSEKRFRSLVENLPTGILRTSMDGEINDASDSIESILGYSSTEIIGSNISDYIPKEYENYMSAYISNLSANEVNPMSSSVVVHSSGELRNVEGRASVIMDEEGQPQEYLFSFNDVTDAIAVEKKLESAKGNYELLFKNMYDAVLLYDFDTETVFDYNKAFAKFFGQENQKIKKLNKEIFIPKRSNYFPDMDVWAQLQKFINRLSRKETVKTRSVFYNKKKEERLAEVSMFPTVEKGNIAYIVIKDITESYLNAQDSKDKTEIYEQLIAQSSEGIDIIELIKDAGSGVTEGRLIVRNKWMAQILGSKNQPMTSVEEVVKIMPEFQSEGTTSEDMVNGIAKELLLNRKTENEIKVSYDDKNFDLNTRHNLVELRDKKYLIRNFLDVTEKKKSEDIIRQQILDLNLKNNELQKYIDSNLQLENFAYIASHDLKAPIRSVISFMQLLKKNVANQLDEKNLKFIDIVLTASTNMQVLIDDLLTYSRINTQDVIYESVDTDKLVSGLLRDLVSVVEESGAIIKIDKLPIMHADSSRVRQVFQNLITNAIKFIPKDRIPEISIMYKKEKKFHHFSVKDNGIGIEPEYLEKIFLMFMKLHSENKYTGTGIGLSICKKVIDQHQGQIWVESKIGEGSTFHFRLSNSLSS